MRWVLMMLLLTGLTLAGCGAPAAPSPTPTVDPRPTVPVLSPAEAAATLTARAALTPTVAPTPTVGPTPTPVPTARPPKQDMTDDQRLYLLSLEQKLVDIYASSGRFDVLMGQIEQEPLRIKDDTWRGKVNAELSFWRATYESSKNVKAPPGLEIVNGKWIEAAGHLNLAADDLSRSLDQDDGQLAKQAYVEMETTGANLDELGNLIDQFNASHGSPLPPAPSSTATVRDVPAGAL